MMSVTLRDILVGFFIVGGSLVALRRYRKAVAARHLCIVIACRAIVPVVSATLLGHSPQRAVNYRVGLFVRVPARIGSSARQLTYRRARTTFLFRPISANSGTGNSSGSTSVILQHERDCSHAIQLRFGCAAGAPERIYNGGKVEPEDFKQARWDLLPTNSYMWASVQTVRGCAKHCSFCSVWRTDGQRPRQRAADSVIEEVVELRRRGFRFIALADDNFYPVTLTDIDLAKRQNNQARVDQLEAHAGERFELMERLSELPKDEISNRIRSSKLALVVRWAIRNKVIEPSKSDQPTFSALPGSR